MTPSAMKPQHVCVECNVYLGAHFISTKEHPGFLFCDHCEEANLGQDGCEKRYCLSCIWFCEHCRRWSCQDCTLNNGDMCPNCEEPLIDYTESSDQAAADHNEYVHSHVNNWSYKTTTIVPTGAVPLVAEADPELEKLLAEEETIKYDEQTDDYFKKLADKMTIEEYVEAIDKHVENAVNSDLFGPVKYDETTHGPLKKVNPSATKEVFMGAMTPFQYCNDTGPLKTHPHIKRGHQTAVFIDVAGGHGVKDSYNERLQRFAYSFNHDQTIKADIYLMVGVRIVPYSAVAVTEMQALISEATATGAKAQFGKAQQWAQKNGYGLAVMATVPGRDYE